MYVSIITFQCYLLTVKVLLSHPTFFGVSTTDQLGLSLLTFAHVLSSYWSDLLTILTGIQILGIFWSIIETGIVIPVACLPLLRPLFHDRSPKSLFNWIRSKISLTSIRSFLIQGIRGSHRRKSKSSSFELEPRRPFANNTGFVGPESRDGETVVTHVQTDVEHGHYVGRNSLSEIQVERKITQSVEHVWERQDLRGTRNRRHYRGSPEYRSNSFTLFRTIRYFELVPIAINHQRFPKPPNQTRKSNVSRHGGVLSNVRACLFVEKVGRGESTWEHCFRTDLQILLMSAMKKCLFWFCEMKFCTCLRDCACWIESLFRRLIQFPSKDVFSIVFDHVSMMSVRVIFADRFCEVSRIVISDAMKYWMRRIRCVCELFPFVTSQQDRSFRLWNVNSS